MAGRDGGDLPGPLLDRRPVSQVPPGGLAALRRVGAPEDDLGRGSQPASLCQGPVELAARPLPRLLFRGSGERRDQPARRRRCEELYVEGLATRDGPESCAVVREGRGEALAGVRAGRAIEPRNSQSGVPTLFRMAEGNIPGQRYRELPGDPARSENQGMCGTFVHENREGPCAARPRGLRAGRLGNAKAVIPGCTARAVRSPRRCAGINRHGGGDGRALHRRSSEPR